MPKLVAKFKLNNLLEEGLLLSWAVVLIDVATLLIVMPCLLISQVF